MVTTNTIPMYSLAKIRLPGAGTGPFTNSDVSLLQITKSASVLMNRRLPVTAKSTTVPSTWPEATRDEIAFSRSVSLLSKRVRSFVLKRNPRTGSPWAKSLAFWDETPIDLCGQRCIQLTSFGLPGLSVRQFHENDNRHSLRDLLRLGRL